MNKNLILTASGIFILMIATFTFSSCSKTEEVNLTKEQNNEQSGKAPEAILIDEKDLSESDEDITTVDYKDFYDLLAPYGEWLEVRPDEIGMKPNTAQSDYSNSDALSLSDIIGIKEAYAVEDEGMVFVWKPSTALAVPMMKEEIPVFRPYTKGQWVYTDAGWYFKAPTPAEETVSHYGRWINSPSAGWLWVPGRVWAPAWVDWKQNDKNLSWAPLPPSVYVENNAVNVPVIEERNYVVVEKKYFLEPQVYKYTTAYNAGTSLFKEMTRIDNMVVVGNSIINRGPSINMFESLLGRVIEPVKIVSAGNIAEVKYTDREYIVYKPAFKKYKNKGNRRMTFKEPKTYKKHEEWKVLKSEEKELMKEEKEIRKDIKQVEKEINKDIRNNDNGSKKNNDDDGKENKGNDSKDKDKGNDNGNKNNDNNNGSKNKNNDNGKGKK